MTALIRKRGGGSVGVTLAHLASLGTLLLISGNALPAFENYFPNHILRDQNGKPQRFYSDLLQGKTVVIHSFFGDCHGSCPVMLGKLKAIQDSFGPRLGQDLLFLSISVDPANDKPGRMLQLADSLHAKSGWIFLSGAKQNIDWVLYKLGQYSPVRDEHSTVFLIGNEATGVWTKLDATMPAESLRTSIQSVLNAPAPGQKP